MKNKTHKITSTTEVKRGKAGDKKTYIRCTNCRNILSGSEEQGFYCNNKECLQYNKNPFTSY